MYCVNCGKELSSGARYCSYCGYAVPTQPVGIKTGCPSFVPLPPVPKTTGSRAIKRHDAQKGCGCLVIIVIVIILIVVNSNSEANKGSSFSADSEYFVSLHKAPILEGAVSKYPETEAELKKAGFPKLLKKLGLENIKKCNKLIPLAAEKASKNKNCDAVMIADISDQSTKDNLIFFVTAKNYTKFYFTEKELMEDGPTLSEPEKLAPLLRKHELMAEEVIKRNLNHPSTYDRHELGVFQSETTPNCNEITIEFSAKNSFGTELTYIATVQFDKDSKVVGFHMQEKL